MSDKYGYIGIETLLNFCENSKDHAVTPNDFMRMKRVREPERKTGKWELIYNQPKSDAWACNVTAKCSCCGEPLVTLGNRLGWGNDRDTGETIIWSGFIINWKDNREQARLFALNCAESVSRDLFPNFCENCGANMRGEEDELSKM